MVWARAHPAQVERFYSMGVFPVLQRVLLTLTRPWPFCVAEWLLAVLACCILCRSLWGFREGRRAGRGLVSLLWGSLLRVVGALGWGYASFLMVWGYNHARLPYAELAGLQQSASISESKTEELAALLAHLVEEANRLRPAFEPAALELRGTGGEADPRLLQGFARVAQHVPALAGPEPILRKPWISPWLTRLGITGIYSPFTAEANLNSSAPPWTQPFSACHEVAHARGFAREDEANFIAWQVCQASGDEAFQYSATYAALGHVQSALAREDPIAALALMEALDALVRGERIQEADFWRAQHSQVTELSKKSNDVYLRSQGQAAGVQSYGGMVELLLAQWRAQKRDEPSAGGQTGG